MQPRSFHRKCQPTFSTTSIRLSSAVVMTAVLLISLSLGTTTAGVNALQRICVPDFFDYLCSIFPIVLAIEGDRFLDVRDPAERYIVMYHHINHFRYANLVAAFRTEQLAVFRGRYVQGT